jgi:hypothetical protein
MDTVGVGLDRFVLDALDGEALEERVEPSDGEGDPARARPRRVRLDEEPGVLVDLRSRRPGAQFATRVVRVRQPTLSRSLDRAERTDSIALSRLAKISSRTTLPSRSSKTCAPSWWISTPLPLPRPW